MEIIIQIVLIIFGWVVVHWLSNARDRDKSRREMLAKAADSLNDELGKIYTSAVEYHVKVRNLSLENSLKMSLQDISARTTLLRDVSVDIKELDLCRSHILIMKKAISANHFEDEHIAEIELGSRQIQEIASSVLLAKRCFLMLKHQQFPKTRTRVLFK